MAAIIKANPIEWTTINGAALHVESSMTNLWALSNKNEIMQCRLPCTEESWWKPLSESNYVSFSVNPFEIWALDFQNRVFRCRFPCLKAGKFHLIAEGFKQVSLGLSEAWAVTGDNRVAVADFEFSKESAPIDRSKLTWNYVGTNIKHISIGEDGEVWGVRTGAGPQQIVRYLASQARWIDVPGAAKTVDVGADYIYAITDKDQVMRCLRPCRNGGWENPSKKAVKDISSRYNNPGVVLAIGANPEENKILVGNSAWTPKFNALDLSMPFQSSSDDSSEKGYSLSAFSPYFIPEWHRDYGSESVMNASPLPF